MGNGQSGGLKDTLATMFIVLVAGAGALGVGWFMGIRPLEWIAEFNSASSYSEESNPGPVYANDPAPLDEAPLDPPPPPQPEYWSCYWDPTMNENWYDDVLCSRGNEYDRPELLTDWDFVTYDDMMAEAAHYEDWLNSR